MTSRATTPTWRPDAGRDRPPGARLRPRVTAVTDDTVSMLDDTGCYWSCPRAALRHVEVGMNVQAQISCEYPSEN